MNAVRTTNAMKAKVSVSARETEIAPRITTMPIVIAVGRVGRLEYFKGGRSGIEGIFMGAAAAVAVAVAGEVSSGGIGGTDRAGIVDEVGVMKVDGTDGRVVLVVFPDCEIVIVVGGIPDAVDVFVL